MTICKEAMMSASIALVGAAVVATAGCASSEAAATNSPPPAIEMIETNVVTIAETNLVAKIAATNVVFEVAATNGMPVKVVYPDDTSNDFNFEDWAEELAAKMEQGVHVKNGHALVVVRLEPIEGEYQSLTKLRAKFRAIEFLRNHFPDIPKEFSASCRVLLCEELEPNESCLIVVLAFRLEDLKELRQEKLAAFEKAKSQ